VRKNAGFSLRLSGARGPRGPAAALTPGMLRVLQLTADGHDIAQTATAHGVGIDTVKHIRRAVLDRLGADTTAQAVAIGFRKGLLK
jgi:DNA-binding CsgD family transcriptional regulator